MFRLDSVIRPHILNLKPYSTARDDFKGEAEIYLDANENPHGSVVHGPYSRYPDPHQRRLKKALASIRGVTPEQVFISHGSDEGIELLVRACCTPGQDAILVMPPTYSMYQISAQINDVSVIEVPLTREFSIDIAAVKAAVTPAVKVMFVCSPNNPTGTVQSLTVISELCSSFSGLIVVDEAYIDFCPESSAVPLLEKHPNLVILQTFSKAWGLPALRVGSLFAQPALVELLSRIKPPYNINGLSQELALSALRKVERKEQMVRQIIESRQQLVDNLGKSALVKGVEPSEANFVLARFEQPVAVYEALLREGIVVRDRSTQLFCEGGLRISVGTPYENARVLAVLAALSGEKSALPDAGTVRRAHIARRTNETAIMIDLDLDGSGECYISTGLGFFDHMLHQLGRHSGINLSVSVQGDLDIDEHHTVEDVGIAIGEALAQALGDKRGIERYGFTAPMDEAQASVSLDFSGRAFLVWEVEFSRERVGDLPTEMVKHFFHSLADASRLTLHVSARGENDHHIIEGTFKAFARALRMAISKTGQESIPSTKGIL